MSAPPGIGGHFIQPTLLLLSAWLAFRSNSALAIGLASATALLRIGTDDARRPAVRALLRLTACGLVAVCLATGIESVLLASAAALLAERLTARASVLEASLLEAAFAIVLFALFGVGLRTLPIGTAFACGLVIWAGLPREPLHLHRETRPSP